MRALVCVKPGELAVEVRPEPSREAGDVLVAVRRIGICGTDFHIYQGRHPYLQYPRVIGHELSGEVLEVPKGSALREGQIVVLNPYLSCGTCHACLKGKPNCCMRIAVLGVHRDGGMCERISVPERNLYAAGGLGVSEAASVEFLAIGAHAVARSALMPGTRTLVVGAGPIGLGTALFARLAGGAVTLMDRDRQRLASAIDAGIAPQALNGGNRPFETVSDATDGDGFDLVFDATGSRSAMESAFGYVAHGGTLVFVGVVPDDVSFSDPEFHKREMTVLASRNALHGDFDRVMAAIQQGLVPLDRLITHHTSLVGAALDLPRWSTDKTGLIKAMVEIE